MAYKVPHYFAYICKQAKKVKLYQKWGLINCWMNVKLNCVKVPIMKPMRGAFLNLFFSGSQPMNAYSIYNLF